jgi:hypothetical protein
MVSYGGGKVVGTVNYDANTKTATFTPSGSLAYSTTYTVTITTGVKDASGNALTSSYTSSFSEALMTATRFALTPPVYGVKNPVAALTIFGFTVGIVIYGRSHRKKKS